jgi:hypothetical protein
MGILQTLQKQIGRMQLHGDIARLQREKGFLSLDEIRTVGIVFVYTDQEEFELLRKYVAYLRELKKKVKAIGLYTTKKEPQIHYSKVDFELYGRSDLNWLGRPKSHILKNFIEEPWDMLIDLNTGNYFTLYAIAALSQARFKVGRFEESGEHIHDLLIDSPTDKGLKYFLRQIDTYLQKINSF